LAEHTNCVIWYDGFVDDGGVGGGAGSLPGNNRPDEGIWVAAGDPTDDDDFEAALDKAESPSDAFDTASDLVIASGTLADLSDTSNPILIDSRNQGDTAEDFSGTACYDDGTVQYLGCVCWLPRNVAGVDDNILQTDRPEYQFGLAAVQCRDNVDDDGIPISPEVASGPGEGDVDGYIRGEVQDADANPVVDVDMVDVDTGLVAATVRTNDNGEFGRVGLPTGSYTAEVDGYTTFATTVALGTNETKVINVAVE